MSKKKTLADLMNNDFFIDFDTQPKRKKLNESASKKEEPDNAVVDCKVNKVIAHCEDEKPVDCLGEKKPLEKPLTEGTRSIEEIKAEIEKLQQELADAEAKEKRADYGRNLPTEVWIYDMYIDPANKGTWTSAELYNGKYDGYVYETADKAIRGGLAHLNELADEGELEGEPIDYTVEAINIPISEVDEDTLADSGLDYLIESLKESLSDVDSVRVMAWCSHHCVDFFEAVANNASKTKQRKLNKEAYKAMKEKFGLEGQEAEDLMCKAYSLWKRLYK